MPNLRRRGIPLRVLLACLIPTLSLAGCSTFTETTINARSVQSGDMLELVPTIRAYRAIDKNTADVYLTDLPKEACRQGAPLGEVSGQILHLHLFISPEAGSTPIDSTACSVTVRLVVVSRGQVGVYGGGGFLQPDSDPGSADFDGFISQATLRFIYRTAGFNDRLGSSELSGSISAPRDDGTADALAIRLDELLNLARRPAP